VRRRMMAVQSGEKVGSGEGTARPQKTAPREPWYRIAQEAAQILVSTLALYASVRAFMEKMKKRRDLKQREEA
jgi:hypothetical protein